jgi:hypothetical protein
MAHITFEKLSEHSASVKGESKLIWRVRVTGSIDEYYVLAQNVHKKLGGGYWTDSKYLIALNKVVIAEAFEAKGYEQRLPSSYYDIICGQCGIINSLNIDNIQNLQGAHYCKSCRSTIALVIGNRVNLKNGSKVESITTK